jgi:hypothetical protein
MKFFFSLLKQILLVITFHARFECGIDRGFEPRSGQTKDYNIGICYFSAKHAALRSKGKDWLVRNQNNVSDWQVIGWWNEE